MSIVARHRGGDWFECPGSKDPFFIHHRVEDAFPLFAYQLSASIRRELANLADRSDKPLHVQELLKFEDINNRFCINMKKSYAIFHGRPCDDNEYVTFVKNAERLQKDYRKMPESLSKSGQMERLFEEMRKMLPDRDVTSAEIKQILRDTQFLAERWRIG